MSSKVNILSLVNPLGNNSIKYCQFNFNLNKKANKKANNSYKITSDWQRCYWTTFKSSQIQLRKFMIYDIKWEKNVSDQEAAVGGSLPFKPL